VRNVFDQYSQPENRLTHALLSTLQSDPALLRRFLRWCNTSVPNGARLKVLEQALPGQPVELSEEEAEKRGLPDGCITDGQRWALLIECKLAAVLKADQLRRHLKTAARKGITDCSLLVLTLDGKVARLPGIRSARWCELYQWLRRLRRKSDWVRRCIDYFELLEANLPSEYLMKGTLTVFAGVPFGPDEPYNYPQAKRLLGLLRDELRSDRRLKRRLRIDPQSAGRGAITGRQADFVWDFIGLMQARRAGTFTQYPHLTVGIHADRVDAYVTVPNGIRSRLRSALLGRSFADFEGRLLGVTRAIDTALRSVKGAAPMVVIVQRHYPTQRSPAVHDSYLRFDPRTALPRSKAKSKVKFQPQWLRATYEALCARRSNLQFQVGAQFPYATCPSVRTRQVIDSIANVWLACRPVLDATAGR
jgi:hypothetical protein